MTGSSYRGEDIPLMAQNVPERPGSCSRYNNSKQLTREGMMPTVRIDKVGEMAIIECAGRFVRSEAALKLRDAVTSQTDAHVVILDLTEMHALGGCGHFVDFEGVWKPELGVREGQGVE